MASWQDPIVQFKEYRPENPLDAMLTVGITKQQQYEEGLQKVQGYMNTLSGFQSQKKEINEYLKGKMSELRENLNNISGDFSDQRLVSQIGGAASKIASDPIVQNGILAQQTISAIQAAKEQARKEGKSSVQNEWYADNKINEWLNDGQTDTKLNASYTQYFDIEKKIREYVKDMGEGENLPEEMLRFDNTGKLVPNEVLLKGKSAKRVQDAIDVVLQSPDAQQQLTIDGAYKFRGLDGAAMYEQLERSTKATLDNFETSIKEAQAKLATMAEGEAKRDLMDHIKKLKNEAKSTSENFGNITELLETNVEAAKKFITQQELNSNLLNSLSYQYLVDNPFYNQWFKQEEFKWKKFVDTETLNLKRLEAERKATESSAAGENNFAVGELPVEQTEGEKGEKTFIEEKQRLAGKVDNLNKKLVYEVFEDGRTDDTAALPNPYVIDPQNPGNFLPNVQGYIDHYKINTGNAEMDRAIATQRIMADVVTTTANLKSQYQSGAVTNKSYAADLENLMTLEDDLISMDNTQKSIDKKFEQNLKPVYDTFGKNPTLVDLYKIKEDLPGSEAALSRLFSKIIGNKITLPIGTGKEIIIKDINQEVETPAGKIKVKDFISGKIRDLSSGNPNKVGSSLSFLANLGFWPNEITEFVSGTSKLDKQLSADLKIKLQQREADYKSVQTGYKNRVAFFNYGKPEQKDAMNARLSAVLSNQTLLPNNNDAKEMVALLTNEETKNAVRPYAYTYIEGGIKKVRVGIQYNKKDSKSLKSLEVSVPEDVFQSNFPTAVADVEAIEKYGARLNMTNGTSTGRITSPGQQPDITRKTALTKTIDDGSGNIYNLQYHFLSSDGGNTYKIKLWVTENGNTVVDGIDYFPDGLEGNKFPLGAAHKQIKNVLSNPGFLKAYLEQIKKNK